MLSGNGRHRRPRQAPALLVAAGVTGSAIAIPLLGAAGAHAADGTTWDKVAECESGGSWSADTGNGYYGGLQLSQEDWDAHGGSRYAASPDLASRSQQIAVAEKVLADRGTKPWATCALLSGLSADSGSVDIDTGVGTPGASDAGSDAADPGDSAGTTDPAGPTGSPDSAGLPDTPPSSDPGSHSGSGSRTGTGSGADSGSADATGTPSADTGTDTDADTGADVDTGATGSGRGHTLPKSDNPSSTGTKRGGDVDSGSTGPVAEDPDVSWRTGSSWSLVDTGSLGSGGRHRGGVADENVTNAQEPTLSGRHASRDADGYTVQRGDTLASIADSLGVDGGWHALYAANEAAVGADPNHIAAGQTLRVGSETGDK